jgi:hypothetical protein
MKNIYGTIGYTLLENKKDKNKVIVLADMHDTLPSCNSKVDIAEWFKSKFSSSEILLEEVPRENVKLKELWEHSPHTQQLKNLYLKNPKIINAVDIRPFLIPFSWEVLSDYDPDYDIKFRDYLKNINLFFCLEDKTLKEKLKERYTYEHMMDTKLGKHYLALKRSFYNYVKKNRLFLGMSIYTIKNHDSNILEDINGILNSMMEWYICAKIELKKKRPIIIHAGLFHSDSVITWLTKLYGYSILKQEGVNTIEESNTKSNINGCIHINNDTDSIFSPSSEISNV